MDKPVIHAVDNAAELRIVTEDVRRPKPRKVSRLLTRAVISAVLATGAMVAAPSAAMASPSWCYTGVDRSGLGGYGHAYCAFGDGYFRVRVSCAYSPSSNLRNFYYGPWLVAGGGTTSYAWCPSDQYIMGATYNF
ncbi:hypothetical protein ACH47V_27350 [Micromonospora chersina]|uniref:hypothetical protein n=1 Tax=Micromonospora chersina TaxID=47854 RepID=UPI0033EC69A4